MKAKKADKTAVDAEVKVLLSLKDSYKKLTGKDWKPGAVAAQPSQATSAIDTSISPEDSLVLKVNAQGDCVRNLKAGGAPKVCM